MSSIFNFPNNGIDQFEPTLVNDFTVVNANHVLDLRFAIEQIEQSLIGLTTLNYSGTSVIQSGDNIKNALEKLDLFISNIASLLEYDSFPSLGRLDSLEDQFFAHRTESGSIDSEGYGVHGIDGYVVGTLNQQILQNKTIDTGTWFVGPKITIRSSLADAGNRQFELYGSDSNLKAWIDEQGNARFKDIILDGYSVQLGVDIVQNSLFVDGYTILGNNSSIDYTTINGNATINGSLTVNSANQTFGNGTGTINLNYTKNNFLGDAYINGQLNVSGAATFGDLSGSDSFLFKGNIIQTFGSLSTAGSLAAAGSSFTVNNTQTQINTNTTNINSNSITIGPNLSIDQYGNINSDGYQFQLGSSVLVSYDTLAVDGYIHTTYEIESNGKISTPLLETQQLNTNQLKIPGANPGDIWQALDALGNGNWSSLEDILAWSSVLTDGYQQTTTDTYPDLVLVPSGAFYAESKQQIFASAIRFSTLSPTSFSIYLPSSPKLGARVRIVDANDTWSSSNPLYVYPSPGTGTIDNQANYELTTPNGWVEFIYTGSMWKTLSVENNNTSSTITETLNGRLIHPTSGSTFEFDQFDLSISGINNTALGLEAGRVMVSGSDNTLQGFQAGKTLISGSNNVMVGSSAGNNVISGSYNTYLNSSFGAELNGVVSIGQDNLGSSPITPTKDNQFILGTQLHLYSMPGIIESGIKIGQTTNSTSYVSLTSENTGSPVSWRLPVSNGLSGQTLVTDGLGNLSWAFTNLDGYALLSDFDGYALLSDFDGYALLSDFDGYALLSDFDGYALLSDLDGYATITSLATVATSGDYSDLTNKPSVPSTLTDLGISDGTSGQVLSTDGSGNFSFISLGGGGGGGGGILFTDLSASNSSTPNGSGSLSYNNSTGEFTYTPPDLDGYATITSLDATIISLDATIASLATVATSGDYSDLTNKPSTLLASRGTASATTVSINDTQSDNITVTGFKCYTLFKVATSAAAWVVIYTDTTSRTNDASRSESTDPAPGSGVLAEVVTTGAQTILMTPAVVGFNNDSPPSNNIYLKVTNKSGSTQAITVTLTMLQLEA